MQQNTLLSPDNQLGMFGYGKTKKNQALEDRVMVLEEKFEKMNATQTQGLDDLKRRMTKAEVTKDRVAFRSIMKTLAKEKDLETLRADLEHEVSVFVETTETLDRDLRSELHDVRKHMIALTEKSWQQIQDVEEILQMNRREERGLDKT
jgi:hypothetical protein